MARQEPDTDIVFQLLFRELAVLLIECKEEKRQRRDNQQNQGNIVAQAVTGQKIGGRSHQRGQHKKISWRRVRPNTTLLLTSVKSFVIFTWANPFTSR